MTHRLPFPQRVAAAAATLVASGSVLTASGVTLAVGLVVVLTWWPASRDPQRTLRYDHATRILVEEGETQQRRMNALFRTFNWVEFGITELQFAAERGELDATAGQELDTLWSSINNPGDVLLRYATASELTLFGALARDLATQWR